jgi:RND family efflux transporter MFP subunit
LYQATLYGKVSGYLKWIGVDKGDVVKEGQLLAVIDAPEIADQYQQAEADYEIKRVTYERYLGVWNDNPDVIAKQVVDVAKAAAQSAKYLRDSRKTLLDYTKVDAPFSGIITARFADPGALIQAATGSATQAAPLFTIMDMQTVRIYVNVPQEAAYLARVNTPGTLTIRELPDQHFEGVISRTTEALDPATRTLLVEIDLPNKERRLQPGMFANATLQLQQHANALAIAPTAIVPLRGGAAKSVFVVEQGRVKSVAIKTGIDDGVWLEILEGLTGDEDVVVVGKGGLNEGERVKASPYNLPAGKPARQKL